MNPVIKRQCSVCGKTKIHYTGMKYGELKPLAFCVDCRRERSFKKWRNNPAWRKLRLKRMKQYQKEVFQK